MIATYDDVFLAVLALDAYNRGVGRGMQGIDGQQIGDATVGLNSDDAFQTDVLSSGFFAQKYTWNNKTIISYRGTTFTGLPSGADVLHGWTLSAGYSGADQAEFAKTFFTLATGQPVYGGPSINGILLTGHSLGGGLAGFVAGLTGANAQIFNNIPFGSGIVADILAHNFSQLA